MILHSSSKKVLIFLCVGACAYLFNLCVHQVMEDIKLVTHIKEAFSDVKDFSVGHFPVSMQRSMTNSLSSVCSSSVYVCMFFCIMIKLSLHLYLFCICLDEIQYPKFPSFNVILQVLMVFDIIMTTLEFQ